MMPTFPSSPLKFRTVSFPQYGFKAGVSGEAFPARGVFPSAGLPSSFVPIAYRVLLPVLCRGTRCAWAPPFEQLLPLYPRGPHSGPGYVVPVHPRLTDPMRPTHRHIPTSPLAAYTRCLRCAPVPRRLGNPRVDPCFRWLFSIDMSSSETPGSSSAACTQFLD
jgi:hypothetical protein